MAISAISFHFLSIILKKKYLFFLLFAVSSFYSYAQVEFSGSIHLNGYYSNNDELPFWMYSNERGRISEETNFSGWINGQMNYAISDKSTLEIGAGILYQDDYLNDDYIDELYADFKYSWFQVIAGRKQEPEMYNGLSATNENFAWSLNARPLPGLQIQTSSPIYFNENKKFGLEFSWEEYLMGNDRFVKGARLHTKSIYLVSNFNNDWQLKAGIRHFAQWGGDSTSLGAQADGFEDYLRVITGRKGSDAANMSDQINVAGSQLGTYELYLTKGFYDFKLKFLYNHFFEDGTGSRYANFPDGRYGIFFNKIEQNKLIEAAIYEFYYTRNQSKNSSAPHKNDYYFWNGIYRSGWTYQQRIIGLPFFDYDQDASLIVGNKFMAHHIGLSGVLNSETVNLPYKLFATYIQKDGTLSKSYTPKRNEIYLNYEIGLLQNPFNLRVRLGAEYSNIAQPIYGAGLSLSKQF